MTEYLDNFLTIQHLFDESIHCTKIDLLADIIFSGQFGKVGCYKQHDTCCQDGNNGKRRI